MTAPSMAYIEAPDMGSLTAAEYRRAMATAGARRDTQVSSSSAGAWISLPSSDVSALADARAT